MCFVHFDELMQASICAFVIRINVRSADICPRNPATARLTIRLSFNINIKLEIGLVWYVCDIVAYVYFSSKSGYLLFCF